MFGEAPKLFNSSSWKEVFCNVFCVCVCFFFVFFFFCLLVSLIRLILREVRIVIVRGPVVESKQCQGEGLVKSRSDCAVHQKTKTIRPPPPQAITYCHPPGRTCLYWTLYFHRILLICWVSAFSAFLPVLTSELNWSCKNMHWTSASLKLSYSVWQKLSLKVFDITKCVPKQQNGNSMYPVENFFFARDIN